MATEKINYNGIEYTVTEDEGAWIVEGPTGEMQYPKIGWSREAALDDYSHLDDESYLSRQDEIESLVGGVAAYNADPFEISDSEIAAEVYDTAMKYGVSKREANNLSYAERQTGDWARWCKMLGAEPEQLGVIYVSRDVVYVKPEDIEY